MTSISSADPRSNETPPRREARSFAVAEERRMESETSAVASAAEPSPIHRERAIAEIAYLLAEKRGFAAGYELDDWLAAEKEVDALMASGGEASVAST